MTLIAAIEKAFQMSAARIPPPCCVFRGKRSHNDGFDGRWVGVCFG